MKPEKLLKSLLKAARSRDGYRYDDRSDYRGSYRPKRKGSGPFGQPYGYRSERRYGYRDDGYPRRRPKGLKGLIARLFERWLYK